MYKIYLSLSHLYNYKLYELIIILDISFKYPLCVFS